MGRARAGRCLSCFDAPRRLISSRSEDPCQSPSARHSPRLTTRCQLIGVDGHRPRWTFCKDRPVCCGRSCGSVQSALARNLNRIPAGDWGAVGREVAAVLLKGCGGSDRPRLSWSNHWYVGGGRAPISSWQRSSGTDLRDGSAPLQGRAIAEWPSYGAGVVQSPPVVQRLLGSVGAWWRAVDTVRACKVDVLDPFG
jgi:hypothetical protein